MCDGDNPSITSFRVHHHIDGRDTDWCISTLPLINPLIFLWASYVIVSESQSEYEWLRPQWLQQRRSLASGDQNSNESCIDVNWATRDGDSSLSHKPIITITVKPTSSTGLNIIKSRSTTTIQTLPQGFSPPHHLPYSWDLTWYNLILIITYWLVDEFI